MTDVFEPICRVLMDKLRLATVGCGYFSQFHHQAWQRLDVDIVGICDLDMTKARSFADEYGGDRAYDDFTAMLSECQPDLVDIILQPTQHLDHIKIACEHSVAVICQKPFTENLAQAKQAVGIAADTGNILAIHENFRFQPWYRRIKELIDQNRLGQIYQIRFDLRPGDGQGADAYLDRQPYFQQMKQFLIRETGVHFIDVFRYLCGEPNAVWADLRQLNPAIIGEDAGIFILEFEHQQRAVFDGNRLSDHVADNHRLTMGEMQIEGELATLELNGRGQIIIRNKGSNVAKAIDLDWDDTGFGGDCVYLMQRHVLEHMQCGAPLENSGDEYLKNLAIQELVYRSNQEGRRLIV